MLLKIIVVCLALANMLYFLWTHGVDPPQEIASSTPPPKTLKLVAEAPEAVRASAADGGGPTAPSAGAVPDPSSDAAGSPPASEHRCVTVGPFRDVAEAARAAGLLRTGGYDPRQRVVEGDVWAGVWVYLPLPPTPGASEQLLGKLKSAGIEDALEMPGPADGSVISLGLFSEQKRAQSRVAQVQGLGLKPALADRKRTGNVYWIDVDLKTADASLNPSDLQSEAGRISRLEIKACPTPAAP